MFPHGVVATSQKRASRAGLEVLRAGGNAVDAAVTAAAVLNVVEPQSTGLGGDLFALVWSAKDRCLYGLNASGRAGSLMTRDEIVRRGHESIPADTAEAVTVPGTLSGWSALLERFGSIPLVQALDPAIGLAADGFTVSPIIAFEWDARATKFTDPIARRTFLDSSGRAPRAGERVRNPDLAETLRTIAVRGPGILYGGELGRGIADWLRARGGFLLPEDFAAHRADWVTPISAPFRGHRVWEIPPNGQGIAALQMLRMLESLDLAGMGHNSARYLHHLIEAKKLAFADLARFVADPAAMDVPPEALLEDSYIAGRRRLIDPSRAAERADPGRPVTAGETIYLAAADAQGNMVSLINSIYEQFGSGLVAPGTGFALQNRGCGFTLQPGLPNTVAPGKRPLHTIIPGFVTRDTPSGDESLMAFGVMGGALQPQGQVQVLFNMFLFGMNPQEAIDAPRFRHLAGREVMLEPALAGEPLEGLRALGHDAILPPEGPQQFGGGQAVMREGDGWIAGSDRRKDGEAAGY